MNVRATDFAKSRSFGRSVNFILEAVFLAQYSTPTRFQVVAGMPEAFGRRSCAHKCSQCEFIHTFKSSAAYRGGVGYPHKPWCAGVLVGRGGGAAGQAGVARTNSSLGRPSATLLEPKNAANYVHTCSAGQVNLCLLRSPPHPAQSRAPAAALSRPHTACCSVEPLRQALLGCHSSFLRHLVWHRWWCQQLGRHHGAGVAPAAAALATQKGIQD